MATSGDLGFHHRKSSPDDLLLMDCGACAPSCTLESAIWSHDTGQQIPCFDRCQLIIVWMSNIRHAVIQGLHDLVLAGWPPCCATLSSFSSLGARARDSCR